MKTNKQRIGDNEKRIDKAMFLLIILSIAVLVVYGSHISDYFTKEQKELDLKAQIRTELMDEMNLKEVEVCEKLPSTRKLTEHEIGLWHQSLDKCDFCICTTKLVPIEQTEEVCVEWELRKK